MLSHCSTVPLNLISESEVQLAKASYSIAVMESGITILSSAVQFLNALQGMPVNPSLRTTVLSSLQLSNAEVPMLSSVLGAMNFVIPEPLKEPYPMVLISLV